MEEKSERTVEDVVVSLALALALAFGCQVVENSSPTREIVATAKPTIGGRERDSNCRARGPSPLASQPSRSSGGVSPDAFLVPTRRANRQPARLLATTLRALNSASNISSADA